MSTETDKTTPDLFAAHAEKTNAILEQLVELNRKSREPEAKPAKEEPAEPVYSQQQLQAWVDEGKITVSQMVDYLVQQGTKKVAEELRREYRQTFEEERKRGTVAERISAYKAAIPELNDQNSDEFKRAAAAFRELVEVDDEPEHDIRTELKALRMAFPDGAKPKPQAPARERTSERQRSVETTGGGAGRSGGERKANAGPWPSWFEDRRIEHYEDMIKRGLYKGHDDPILKKEIEILEKKRKAKAA